MKRKRKSNAKEKNNISRREHQSKNTNIRVNELNRKNYVDRKNIQIKKDGFTKKKKTRRIKFKVLFIALIIIACFAAGVFVYSNLTKSSLCVKEYFSLLKDKNYEEMYELVSTELSKDEFVNRVKNIYEGIEAENITVTVGANSIDKENGLTKVTYTNSMDTLAGNLSFVNTVSVKEENQKYKIIWDSSVIYPDLDNDEKVRVSTTESTRGTIYDRNNIPIAKDGTAYQVGLVPCKIENKESTIKQVASLLNMDEETINASLGASYVTDTTFVPLKKISKEEQDLKLDLLKIKGIMITDTKARVYPYKNATSIMTGYVQEKDGKSGLEYAFNDKLKGEDGKEIYIEKNGEKQKTIIKKNVVDGENIKLTIDVEKQKSIYEKYKDDEACVVNINYNTGEIIALVSTPSYDANDFSIGMTNEEWQKLQSDEKKPMYNRYLATYVPGSSIKPVVGAIGIETNKFMAREDFGKSGLKWQKDSSWKNLYVTTLETYQGDANLENALIYSDNIYFAKAALKIGKETLQNGLNNLGFNEKIEFVQDVQKSTFGQMDSEASLANSGYGQAEMLVNPIHMASIYSSFANEGTMVKPYLVYEDEEENKVKTYKQQVFTSKTSSAIKEALKKVVEEGTAKDCKIEGKNIYGKTGTAEIKQNQDDQDGEEIGWFDAFDDEGNLLISMCENVKNRGGSHLVVKRTKEIFEEII